MADKGETMKIPTFEQPQRAAEYPSPRPAPDAGGRAVYGYTYGRLRPRFASRGPWHELLSRLPKEPTPAPDTDDFERLLLRAFTPGSDEFYLARELVWPLEDVFGVPQCVVVPRSDEQILELLGNLCPATGACAQTTHSVVRGVFGGTFTDLVGMLAGLPELALVSAIPYDIKASVRAPAGTDDRSSLFTAFEPLLANNGVGDELRAINYVLTQSSALYELASSVDERARDPKRSMRLFSLQSLPAEGSRAWSLMDVVASFLDNASGAVHRWSIRVDVSGPLMFLPCGDRVFPFYGRPASRVVPQWDPPLQVAPAPAAPAEPPDPPTGSTTSAPSADDAPPEASTEPSTEPSAPPTDDAPPGSPAEGDQLS